MEAVAAPRRSTTSVDLGDLRERLAEVSAAAGVGPSTWLRELARRELATSPVTGGSAAAASVPTGDAPERGVYRAWLDAELTSKLDLLTASGGFRTRAAALRGLLDGVAMGGSASASLGSAIEQLGISNHRLVGIGRNVNQIAKAMNVGRALNVADRLVLDQAVEVIRVHLETAAGVVGELRPLLKTKRADS